MKTKDCRDCDYGISYPNDAENGPDVKNPKCEECSRCSNWQPQNIEAKK
jgi:hypothetical protein